MDKELLNDIIKTICDIIEVDKDDLNLKTNLVNDLELESLDLLDIVVAFEEKYNFEIPDQDVKNLQTIEDIYNYIKDHA